MLKKFGGFLLVSIPLVSVVSCSSKEEYFISKFIENDTSYINNKTIKILDKKIGAIKNNAFNYLKKIHIVDSSFHNKIEESIFFKKTNEIYLNIHRLKNLNFSSNEHKAEYMYELIFHEYLHFLNESFLNNIEVNDNQRDETIYSGYNRKKEVWNKSFLRDFKKILKYDSDTKHYQSTLINKKFVSLGSIYNQKELFEEANGQKQPEFKKLTGNEVMSPINPKIKIDNSRIIRSGDLKYLYSLEELVARKIQVASMVYKPNITSGEGFNEDGMIVTKDKIIPSPYLEDFLNYSRSLKNDGIYLKDVPNSGLVDMYYKYVHNISDIEQITFKNNIFFNKKTERTEGKVDHKLISISGFSNSKKFIGYIDNNKFVNIDAKWKETKFSNKNIFTYSSSFVDPLILVGKKLVFSSSISGDDIIKFKTYRHGEFGETTTYKTWDHDSTNFSVKIVKNNIVIVRK